MREYKGRNLIALPASYVAIDIETTGLDYEFCHIIEVSAIRYRNGIQLDKYVSLVKPPLSTTFSYDGSWESYYVDEYITELTGITNDMLKSAPDPTEVYPQLKEFLGESILVAHNANFDINFLYDAFGEYANTFLSNDFIDTMRIARKVFPELKHHRLCDVAKMCHVEQPASHRAEADCIVAAQCFEKMRSLIFADKTEDEFRQLFAKKAFNYYAELTGIVATVDSFDDSNPIFEKVIVFTGALSSMSRKEAFQLVANLGAVPDETITKKTNYLVIGDSDFAKSVKDGKTTKMKKAESLRQKGYEISIISERAFWELIADYINY